MSSQYLYIIAWQRQTVYKCILALVLYFLLYGLDWTEFSSYTSDNSRWVLGNKMKLKYKEKYTLDPKLYTMKTGGIKYMCDAAHQRGDIARGDNFELFVCLFFLFDVLVPFLSFEMTPHLSKLIKVFKFYNWKAILFPLLFSTCFHL